MFPDASFPDAPAPVVVSVETDRRAVLRGDEVSVHWRTRHADHLQIVDVDGFAVAVDAFGDEGVTPFRMTSSGVLRAVAYNATGRAERRSAPIAVFEPARVAHVPLPVLDACPRWIGPLPEPLRLRPAAPRAVPAVARWSAAPGHDLVRRDGEEPGVAFVPAPDPRPRRRWSTWPGRPGPWTWMTFDEARADVGMDDRRRWWRRRARVERR